MRSERSTMFCIDRSCLQRFISGFLVSFSPRSSCTWSKETSTRKISAHTRTRCGGEW